MNDGFARPHSLANPGATVSPVIYGDDRQLFAEFTDEEVYNKPKSDKEGRAVFDTVVYCNIMFPGDRSKTFKERVKMVDDEFGPSHPHRFPRQWAQYQAQHEQAPEGYSLEQWPPMTKARIRELKGMHIHTVEQIATISDQNGPSLGLDWRQLRDMAIATLKPAESAVQISQLHKQVADLQNQMAAMIAAQSSKKESEAATTDNVRRGSKMRGQPGPDIDEGT